jgi:hypothetical protein
MTTSGWFAYINKCGSEALVPSCCRHSHEPSTTS